MKDHINEKVAACTKFLEVKAIIDDYMDYYNNRRYQWKLAKLAPNEFYQFIPLGYIRWKSPTNPKPQFRANLLESWERKWRQGTVRWTRQRPGSP